MSNLNPDQFPVSMLHEYDNLDVTGNDGYTQERLEREVKADGRIKKPLEIGHSATEMEQRGDHSIYVFDGHHRLAAAKALGITHVPVVSSWKAFDAVPVKGIPNEFGEHE